MEFKGTDKNKNNHKICSDITEAANILKEFNNNYGDGAGIYFVVASYTMLKDF